MAIAVDDTIALLILKWTDIDNQIWTAWNLNRQSLDSEALIA